MSNGLRTVAEFGKEGCEMKFEEGWTRTRLRATALGFGMAGTVASFALTTVGTTVFADRHHPGGTELYVLAALPTFPVVCMLAILGMYLASERDEFRRGMVVRSLLWAIGATLAVGVFLGYVREFGGGLKLPAFTEMVAFWVVFGIVHAVQMRRYRVESDD